MSLHFISAENIRKPLQGILDSIITLHISHRLVDNFLILTPDMTSNQDIIHTFLKDSRLGNILTGNSILTLKRFIEQSCEEINPNHKVAPPYILETLFRSLLHSIEKKSHKLSEQSLYQLILSFREEFLSSEHLYTFLQSFDQELAQLCVKGARQYEDQIDQHPYLKDFVWQTNFIFKQITSHHLKKMNSLRRIYYLGFHDFPPLLKRWIQCVEKSYPEIEQFILCQIPQNMDPQDHLSKAWESALPDLHHFKEQAPILPKIEVRDYVSPFDESSDSLRRIIQLIESGTPVDSIALYLPSNPFWKRYYSQQLHNLGLMNPLSLPKKLSGFSCVVESTTLPLEKAIDHTRDLHLKKRELLKKNLKNISDAQILSDEIKALNNWEETLEELHYYKNEYPFLESSFPTLLHIAHHSFLKVSQSSSQGFQLRSIEEPGLQTFTHAFAIQVSDDQIPKKSSRFFGFTLPHFETSTLHQKAAFQHLLGSSQSFHLSFSKLSTQAQEMSPSPFLADYDRIEKNKTSPLLWISRSSTHSLEDKAKIEILRNQDLSYSHAFGGLISDSKTHTALKKWVESHAFTPSQLEKYAACPFTFLSAVLFGIKPDEEKTLESSALEQGNWLHVFLENLFSHHLPKLKAAGLNPTLRENIFKEVKVNIFHSSKEFLKDKNWIHPDLFKDFTRRALKTTYEILELFWKQWENQKPEQVFVPAYFEKEFSQSTALRFNKKNLPPLHIRGRIDRIDLSEDKKEFISWDYKTGDIKTLSRDIKDFKKLQLPFYFLASEQLLADEYCSRTPGCELHPEKNNPIFAPLGASFSRGQNIKGIASLALGLKEMVTNQGIALKEEAKKLGFKGRVGSLLNEEEWIEFWKNFENKILEYYSKIYSGDFRTMPEPCSEHCDYRTICRYHERKKA